LHVPHLPIGFVAFILSSSYINQYQSILTVAKTDTFFHENVDACYGIYYYVLVVIMTHITHVTTVQNQLQQYEQSWKSCYDALVSSNPFSRKKKKLLADVHTIL